MLDALATGVVSMPITVIAGFAQMLADDRPTERIAAAAVPEPGR